MSKRDNLLLLDDMLQSAQKIKQYTEEHNFNSFISDDKTKDAVVRNFEVIGEAANRIDPVIYKQLDNELQKRILLYFSYGSKDMKQVKKWTARLKESLSSIELTRIEWKNEVYMDKNHNNCDLISLINGLRY